MSVLFSIGIIAFFLFVIYQNEIRQKEELKRKKQIQKERENALYEIFKIVDAGVHNDIFTCVLERKNKTYSYVQRKEEPFQISNNFKMFKKDVDRFKWITKDEYDTIQNANRNREIILKEELQKEEARKIQLKKEIEREANKATNDKLKMQLVNAKNNQDYFSTKILKKDWIDFERIVQLNNIDKLYHFTDIANLDSIFSCEGLLSWQFCKNNNIAIPKPGGNELSRSLDIKFKTENYVRLSLVKDHPMLFVSKREGRIKNPVILEIDPKVIYFKTTKFSNMNATKTGHTQGNSLKNFEKINFEIILNQDLSKTIKAQQQYCQAEIMIFEKVPINYIMDIYQYTNK